MKFSLTLICFFIGAQMLLAAPLRESKEGYFILKDKKVFFTEIYHSTAPIYEVQWWNNKKPKPLCAVNINPACMKIEISFERKIISSKTVLAHAIYTEELRSLQAELKKLKKSR